MLHERETDVDLRNKDIALLSVEVRVEGLAGRFRWKKRSY